MTKFFWSWVFPSLAFGIPLGAVAAISNTQWVFVSYGIGVANLGYFVIRDMLSGEL